MSSIFYGITFVALFGTFLMYKKTEKEEMLFTWLPLTAILVEFYGAFLAGVMNLIHIPVNMVSLGVWNLAAALVFGFLIFKTKSVQKYKINISDFVFVALLVAVIWHIADYRWGIGEWRWTYATVDPAAHFREAMEFVNNKGVSRMFFAQFVNGSTIELFSPWESFSNYYRLYVLSDCLQLILSGAMFYGLVIRFAKDRFGKAVAVAGTFLYLLAYPLSNTIYGFTYLGMSLYVIAAIAILMDLFVKEEIQPKVLNVILLMLGAHAIFQCYVLFMPATYLAMGFALLMKQWQRKKLISFETILDGLGIFLLPIVLGLVYTYMDVFVNDNVTVGDAFKAEGLMYRDLYSNFLFFAPLAVFGFIVLLKKKENTFFSWFAPIFLIQSLVMLRICYTTWAISAYYYYKTHFVLWLIVTALLVYALCNMNLQARLTSVLYMCSIGCVALFIIFGMEAKLNAKNFNLMPEEMYKARAFTDIMVANYDTIVMFGSFSEDYMSLNRYVRDEIIEKGKTDHVVPLCSITEYTYLYEGMTGQSLEDYQYWKSTDALVQYFENVKESDYACVYKDCSVYEEWKDFWDQFEVEYETPIGKVVKIENITIEP